MFSALAQLKHTQRGRSGTKASTCTCICDYVNCVCECLNGSMPMPLTTAVLKRHIHFACSHHVRVLCLLLCIFFSCGLAWLISSIQHTVSQSLLYIIDPLSS